MKYFSEFKTLWRFLLSSSLGMAAGYTLVSYVNNLFTPHLLAYFSWSRSDVALVGVAAFLGIVTMPVAGRLTDRFGVRKVAAIGVIASPLVFIGFASMTGSIWQFFLLTFAQILVVGGTTSAVVYNRLIAQSFNRARGAAFAIAASAAPVAGALMAPFIAMVIEHYSWRAGYLSLAGFTAVCGLLAWCLVPRHITPAKSANAVTVGLAHDYKTIAKNRSFQLIFLGFILCNFAFTMQTQHLQVILLDNGVSTAVAAIAISIFAISVITGRMVCGFALDRFPSYRVATIALGLPSVGLGLLAMGVSDPFMVAVAVLSLGVALGAEIDVLAYLVSRFFPLRVFSTVLGLLMGGFALSMASGALLLSFALSHSESYTAFLTFCSISALIGASLFMRLRRAPAYTESETSIPETSNDTTAAHLITVEP